MQLLLAVCCFIVVMVIVVWRPRGIHEAVPALVGALIMLAVGLLVWADVRFVWNLVWNATFSLIGIMVLASVLHANGFFRWSALHLVHAARGNRMKLYVGLILLGSLITIFFNNDGTILILIPIVIEITILLRMKRREQLAFLIAIGFIADTASAPLMMSNLTNILTADFFNLSFAEYARQMIIPGLAAIAASIGMLVVVFRKSIGRGEDPTGETVNETSNEKLSEIHIPKPAEAIVHIPLFYISWLILAVMAAGYLLSETLGIPVSIVACAGGGTVWCLAVAIKVVQPLRTARETPWLVIVFALGMYLIVYSVILQGGTDWLESILAWMSRQGDTIAILSSGFLFSILASLLNNLPSVLVSSLSIGSGGAIWGEAIDVLPFTNLIGNTIGPKLTPIGSLATLLWLQLLRQSGLHVTWREYMRYGLLLTPPVLLVSLLAYRLTVWLFAV